MHASVRNCSGKCQKYSKYFVKVAYKDLMDMHLAVVYCVFKIKVFLDLLTFLHCLKGSQVVSYVKLNK